MTVRRSMIYSYRMLNSVLEYNWRLGPNIIRIPDESHGSKRPGSVLITFAKFARGMAFIMELEGLRNLLNCNSQNQC